MTPKVGSRSQNERNLATLAVVLAAAFWSLFEIPCPNCAKRLGSVGFWVSVGRVSKVPEHCPHCGVGVDVDVPNPSKAGAER